MTPGRLGMQPYRMPHAPPWAFAPFLRHPLRQTCGGDAPGLRDDDAGFGT
eukprot:CAMPEP_0194383556 /NCGR_PEP_ID=MMETSP0174-20130528/67987_1 /TAXON_ID=216777 /ORGANISM="Proboscia alata, Strain PI-D3" /LENGTH=49 /DNA_ID= /DNA_START= /DNA_END= /DNA_ORIENTATION=